MQKFVGVDYFNIESLLSADEKMIRDTVREFVSAEIILFSICESIIPIG